MTSAAEVLAMLRRHYLPEGRPAGGIFAAEIQAPEAARRADLIWAPIVPSAGRGLVGHEVKVTRSDVLTELADPTKCEAWAQFCTQWWLVVADPSLVEGLDVPEAWGVMAPPSGRRTRTMTVLRAAPTRKVHDTGPAWRRLTGWYHQHVGVAVPRLQHELDCTRAELARMREQHAQTVSRAARTIGPDEEFVAQVVAILRSDGALRRHHDHPVDVPSISPYSMRDPQEVADAVLDLARSRHLAQDARHAADRVLRALETLSRDTERVSRQLREVDDIAHPAAAHQVA